LIIRHASSSRTNTQAKLAAELSAAGLTEREFDWGDLARLPYLNAVIKESLRVLAPASTGTVRIAHRDMTICGHHVPKVSTQGNRALLCRISTLSVIKGRLWTGEAALCAAAVGCWTPLQQHGLCQELAWLHLTAQHACALFFQSVHSTSLQWSTAATKAFSPQFVPPGVAMPAHRCVYTPFLLVLADISNPHPTRPYWDQCP
jgi:hypothetical protein